MSDALSRRQKRVLRYIQDHVTFKGEGPTLRDIQDFLGVSSPNAAWWHVAKLVDQGLVRRSGGSSGYEPCGLPLNDEERASIKAMKARGVTLTTVLGDWHLI